MSIIKRLHYDQHEIKNATTEEAQYISNKLI